MATGYNVRMPTDSSSGSGSATSGGGLTGAQQTDIGMGVFELWMGFQRADMVRRQADMNLQVAEFNASLLREDAFKAEQDGQAMVADYNTQIEGLMATQDATMILYNIDSDFGTASKLVQESELYKKMTVSQIEQNAHMKALGFERQARQLRMNAILGVAAAGVQAKSMEGAAMVKFGGDMIKTGTKAASGGAGA